jgi:hypothetical protein
MSRRWTYLKCFLLAVLIEVIALVSLLPGLATIGTSHSQNTPPNDLELFSERAGFILHLPTILLTLPFKDSRLPIIFFTPVLQVAFFTFVFVLFSRWRRER